MIKYERVNGNIEYFTDNKEEFLELVEKFKVDESYSFGGDVGKTFSEVSYDEAMEMIHDGKNVFIDSYNHPNVVYFYGQKVYHLIGGYKILNEEDYPDDEYDKSGIQYLAKHPMSLEEVLALYN